MNLSSLLQSALFPALLLLQVANGDNDTNTIQRDNTPRNSNATLNGRRICPMTPPINVNFTLSEKNMTDIYEASKLCKLIYPDFSGYIQGQVEEQRKNYEIFDAWGDLNDQAAVAKTATGVCHATFAGSSCWNPLDQFQNLHPGPKQMTDNCWIRKGYFDAYNTSYKNSFRRSLDDCMSSCGTEPCELILSGYSQGGAVAVVASMDLKHYNPFVITFGAPHPFLLFLGGCQDFDDSRHFQFVNVFGGLYDRVAQQINPYFATHLGKLLLLDGESHMIGHPREVRKRRGPRSYVPHILYFDRVADIYNRGCFPVLVGGWVSGHDCNYDDECDSGKCARRVCQHQ
ncbi:expressed unknown protein [Seminavis robusta]|uniref:Fungal lipase-type domain-containing protein n=1 Tax=Seminavis robusta TaxID=568900 RepID=A0A9N8EYM0_9STRA|nr:expressed unknown protein [Seminavis robusta]|eukprot:Sro1947_g307110.1 n/a (343) ;mRNA; r:2727-3867